MSVFQVIAQNLLGFDLIIFVAAALNLACYCLARRNADRLYRKLHMMVFIPSRRRDPESVSRAIRDIDEERVLAMRKRSESLYSVFVNVTSIFPLLGILGTVVSLLPMVSELADMQTNFFAALTSTFWGLVFAILFKLLDGFLSSRMEDNDKAVNLLLERRELLDEGREA